MESKPLDLDVTKLPTAKSEGLDSIISDYLCFSTYKFKKNLKLLNDVLATTELSDKYFLWGGLLLGWAREGRILPWDTDADFFYSSKDRDKFLISVDCLIQAGFKLKERFINNEGRITEYVFFKDDIKFEFFEFDKQEDTLRYWLYAPYLAL